MLAHLPLAGDAQRALTPFEESLKIRKLLHDANPNSALAARDLLVSLERLSDVTGSTATPEATASALAMQLALTLYQANPSSASVGRAAVSAYRRSQKAHAAGSLNLQTSPYRFVNSCCKRWFKTAANWILR